MPNAGVAPKFARNLHEICTVLTDLAPQARVAAPISNNRRKRTDVRWDGTFKRPLTPSAAQDTANRVVRRRKNQVPCFCAPEKVKKKFFGGRSRQRCVRGNMIRLLHVV